MKNAYIWLFWGIGLLGWFAINRIMRTRDQSKQVRISVEGIYTVVWIVLAWALFAKDYRDSLIASLVVAIFGLTYHALLWVKQQRDEGGER